MEFLLLGPLEVHSARERLPLGGPRRRALLANLALHAGAVVSMDTLVDDLWSGEPPPTAEAVVQNGIAHLRRVLGRETIETRAPGYVLLVDPGAIDAHRFERLVREARPLPPAERSAALRDALALWRGPAFADLAYESFLQEEIARLDELRLTALEDRLEAEIELRRHDAVVAESAALVAQHPSRERLCRLLMLALHRAGRQQEALDAYEVLRRSLDELYGLEPSAESRALQVMILTQDSAIAAAHETPRSEGRVRRPLALLAVELLLDEELELETAGAIVSEARRTLEEVAARHGGTVAPESSVELLSAFGADGAHEDDVLRAARAGIEVREIVHGRDVESRFAVGTGRLLVEDGRPVLVGAVVVQTRAALRDAASGEILLTAAAARLGGEALDLDTDGRLLAVRPGRPRPSAAPGPFVGRAVELEGLRTALGEVVATGLPKHVVVVAEAGIGKTRLVSAAFEDASAVVLEAACVPYGEGITFLPLRELAECAATLDEDAPELGELTSADAALAAARTLLEHFTASGPVVLVLDDMHWAVPTFLDLVEYLVRAVDGPLLVVTATRPELLEDRPAWGVNATTLDQLAGDDARALVDALPERDQLDEQVARSIVEVAKGVPLFLEQLAAHGGESDLRDEIPSTLDALLASRIDALEPGERDVLSRAAVVGRTFSRASLDGLTSDSGGRELDGRLASLERRRLVRLHATEHEFVHPLVHGAAYEAIGRSDRAALHLLLARWLDHHDHGDELVGAHLERAALDTARGPERDARAHEASARLGEAGQRALAMLDQAAAVNLLTRAAGLLDDRDDGRLQLECSLGLALKGLGEFDRAVPLLESVAERACAANDRQIATRASLELIVPRLLGGSLSPDAASAQLDDATVRLEGLGDTYGVARAELTHAFVRGDWGDRADLAIAHLERANHAFRLVGLEADTDVLAAECALRGSTPVLDAIRLCEESISARPERLRINAYVGCRLAVLRALLGDIDGARASSEVARAQLTDLGDEAGLMTSAAAFLGSVEALADDWERAENDFRPALAYARDQPTRRMWHGYFLARLAEAALRRELPDDAVALAEEARGVCIAGDLQTEILWRRVAGRALAATGRARRGLVLVREAVEHAGRSDDLVQQGVARLDLAEVALRLGHRRRGAEVAREGIALLDRKGALLVAVSGRSRFALAVDANVEDAASAAPSRLS